MQKKAFIDGSQRPSVRGQNYSAMPNRTAINKERTYGYTEVDLEQLSSEAYRRTIITSLLKDQTLKNSESTYLQILRSIFPSIK